MIKLDAKEGFKSLFIYIWVRLDLTKCGPYLKPGIIDIYTVL